LVECDVVFTDDGADADDDAMVLLEATWCNCMRCIWLLIFRELTLGLNTTM
jgi:hypothetical protein